MYMDFILCTIAASTRGVAEGAVPVSADQGPAVWLEQCCRSSCSHRTRVSEVLSIVCLSINVQCTCIFNQIYMMLNMNVFI